MRILFDQGTPAPLRRHLPGHEVETAFERGWSELQNGQLLAAAQQAGFDVFISTDGNLKHQQNLKGQRLAVVVILSASWPRMQGVLQGIAEAVAASTPGSYREVAVPSPAS